MLPERPTRSMQAAFAGNDRHPPPAAETCPPRRANDTRKPSARPPGRPNRVASPPRATSGGNRYPTTLNGPRRRYCTGPMNRRPGQPASPTRASAAPRSASPARPSTMQPPPSRARAPHLLARRVERTLPGLSNTGMRFIPSPSPGRANEAEPQSPIPPARDTANRRHPAPSENHQPSAEKKMTKQTQKTALAPPTARIAREKQTQPNPLVGCNSTKRTQRPWHLRRPILSRTLTIPGVSAVVARGGTPARAIENPNG